MTKVHTTKYEGTDILVKGIDDILLLLQKNYY